MTDNARNANDNNTSTDVKSNNTPGGSESGGRHKQKLRGAAEVIHGLGDNFCGRLVGTINPQGARSKIEKGQREIEHGLAKITGGPGVDNTVHGCATRSSNISSTTSGNSTTTAAATEPVAQQGSALEPISGIMAGFNAGPTLAMVEAPHQQQYSAASTTSAAFGRGDPAIQPAQNSTNRDFRPHASSGALTPGPAPDHSTLTGDPQLLGWARRPCLPPPRSPSYPE
ncbi:hypothetical protein C8Q70DRAFT_586103 [Cubamyces menziesii]|nr:hypothetical protein C8Q70DRAFT_586103 [Cubamyces menziesii]